MYIHLRKEGTLLLYICIYKLIIDICSLKKKFVSTQVSSGLEISGVGACGTAIKFWPSSVAYSAMAHIILVD